MRDKKGQTSQWGYIVGAVIAIAVIVTIAIFYMAMSGKGGAWLDFFKNLARGR